MLWESLLPPVSSPLLPCSTVCLWRWVLVGRGEHRNPMVLPHTSEPAAGVSEHIKVNGRHRAAKLRGLLLNWHIMPVN